ncbi:AAA family ATPase [Planotetraspora sp. GP83]|uniref:ATP-binding protein n=1 Tax=Planotetraspora sp. GP83 TaxID=3156264 RepID=UPI0035121980
MSAGLTLYGRERETRLLDRLLDRSLDGVHGRGGALVLRGDAGIGKSSLLAAVREGAPERGFEILSTTGVQAEAHLPFAGLHQLLQPVLKGADRLPGPQRRALLAAFGMADSAAPDLFLIALAALELLAESAARAPLLLIVEDVQWLDQPTCDALAFVARRLAAEPVIMLAALRDGFDSPLVNSDLDELVLGGIDDEAAGALLDARAPGLPTAARERVIKDAAGNPLALVELPGVLAGQAGGPVLLPEVLPLTARLERAFASRVAGLPDTTRMVLLAAAVNDTEDLPEILGVASVLCQTTAPAEAVEPAIDAGLVDIGGVTNLRFRHPLVRSAIYHTAPGHRVQQAHAALATLLADQPDRRAWHRASATVLPDEEVALELEQAARRARRRGAVTVAVTAQQRAAELTPDPRRRGSRLLDTAEMGYELGRQALSDRLRREAEALPLSPRDRTRAVWLRGAFDDGTPGDAAGLRELVALADDARAGGDTDLALQLLVRAARRCWWGDFEPAVRVEVVAAGARMGAAESDPRLLAIQTVPDPAGRSPAVADRLSRWDPGETTDPADAVVLSMAAFATGDFERCLMFLAGPIDHLREQGRLGPLARALVLRASSAWHLGNLSVARQAAQEGRRLAEETAQPVWAASAMAWEALVAGVRGEHETAEELADEAERWASATGNTALLSNVQLALGVIALGREQYAAAFQQLLRLFDPGDPAYHHVQRFWAIGYLAEAAFRGERRDRARAVLAELEPLAALTTSSGIGLGMRFARPLLADGSGTEALFTTALEADVSRWPYHQARLHLAYGGWLRRQRRVAESRAPLRAAIAAFDSLGAVPWSERARRELRAAGETSRTRDSAGWDLLLSPQELQIAQLAAEGLSNREIGQRLFLSHRTVGSHLYRIFPKLGITSRTQLRGVARDTPD